jgi:hypothetical protein
MMWLLLLACPSPEPTPQACSEDEVESLLSDPAELDRRGESLELSAEEVRVVAVFWVYLAAMERGELSPALQREFVDEVVPAVRAIAARAELDCTSEVPGLASGEAKEAPDSSRCPDSCEAGLVGGLLLDRVSGPASKAVSESKEGARLVELAAEGAKGASTWALDDAAAAAVVSVVAGAIGVVSTGGVAVAAAAVGVGVQLYQYGTCLADEEAWCDRDLDGQTASGGDCDEQDGRNLLRLQSETPWIIGERECEEARDLDCSGAPPSPEECAQFRDEDLDGITPSEGDCDDSNRWKHPYSDLSSDDRDTLDWWECTYEVDFDCSGSLPSEDRCACELGFNAPEGQISPAGSTITDTFGTSSGSGGDLAFRVSYTFEDDDEDGSYDADEACLETYGGTVLWLYVVDVLDPDGGPFVNYSVERISGTGTVLHDSYASAYFMIEQSYAAPGCGGSDSYSTTVEVSATDCAGWTSTAEVDVTLEVRGPDAGG